MNEGATFWIVGALTALLVGIAKTGMPGLGILMVPLMAMIWPAKNSVGALLPLLLIGDVAAVLFFRRHANWSLLWKLFPWTFAGIAIATVTLKIMTDAHLKPLLGALVLALLVLELARQRVSWLNKPHQKGFTAFAGALTGFATTVGNVAGPIANIFLIGKGFAKREFMGTVAWYFLIINATKLPIFIANGMITPTSLRFDAILLPAVVIGGLLGRRLLHALPERTFQHVIIFLSAVAALKLLWDGLR